MAKVNFKMSPGWESSLAEQMKKSPEWAKIQRRADEQVRALVVQVNTEMSGGEADAIEAELTKRLKTAKVKPNPPRVREIAESIAAGTFA